MATTKQVSKEGQYKKGEPEIITKTRGEFDTDPKNWTDKEFSYPERVIRVATSFSGIGAPEKALERLGLKTKIVFACDIGERYLKYTYNQLRNFIKDFSEEDKEAFAKSLWEENKAGVDSTRIKKAKKELREKGVKDIKESEIKIKNLTLDEVKNNLLGDEKSKGDSLQLTEDCMKLLFKYKGLTTQEEKETYVTSLYDEKGVNWVKESFFANHDIDESAWHTDIYYMDTTPYKGQVDLYVGGSPCQSYSRSGKRLALADMRGTLFYQFAKRIEECQPKIFIFENVKGMMDESEGEKSGLEVALEVFDSLGYKVYWQILNAKDYGIPQNRERIWAIGFRNDVAPDDFKYPAPIPLTTRMYDYLDEDKLPRNGKVVQPYIRHLTGTECLRLMGFTDFKIAPKLEEGGKEFELTKNRILCEQAGNSMVVDCIMALYRQMDITKYGSETE